MRTADRSREPVLVQKARSALRAARALADAHPDSAASRAYYAVHNALRWRYGADIPRGHGGVADPALLGRVGLSLADGDEIVNLQYFRHRAGYDENRHVEASDARASVRAAAALLTQLGVDPR